MLQPTRAAPKVGSVEHKSKISCIFINHGTRKRNVLGPNIQEPLVKGRLKTQLYVLFGHQKQQALPPAMALMSALFFNIVLKHASWDAVCSGGIRLLFSTFNSVDYCQLCGEQRVLPFHGSHHINKASGESRKNEQRTVVSTRTSRFPTNHTSRSPKCMQKSPLSREKASLGEFCVAQCSIQEVLQLFLFHAAVHFPMHCH